MRQTQPESPRTALGGNASERLDPTPLEVEQPPQQTPKTPTADTPDAVTPDAAPDAVTPDAAPDQASPDNATEAPVQSATPASGCALPDGAREEVWHRLQSAVRERVQPEHFETWFRRAALRYVRDDVVCIAVQNKFSRDWLQTYYKDIIEDAVQVTLGGGRRLEFHVDPELTMKRPALDDAREGATDRLRSKQQDLVADRSTGLREREQQAHSSPAFSRRSPAGAESRHEDRTVNRDRLLHDFAKGGLVRGSDVGLNPKYTFENYVVGPCNRFAHAATQGAAESPGNAYNPLFLHGSVGLGKTHLLQSMCFALLENYENVRILYLSCETFVNHFIGALENGDLKKFRNKYRNVDVLVVDDIHLLANKERTQEEFFHTFNTLHNAGKQIVLSSDSPPKDIPTLQERLVSRFKWGLVTEVEPPCYETRMAILKRKSRDRGREIPDDVASLLSERIDTNIRELEGAVTKLMSYARLSGQAVNVDLAHEALPELFTRRRGQPSMEEIIDLVTAHYGVKLSDLQSKKRTNAIAYPRQVAMYLARKITRHSLAEIGGFFGGRDHSTVLHAVDKIDKLIVKDEQCRDVVCGFLDELQRGR